MSASVVLSKASKAQKTPPEIQDIIFSLVASTDLRSIPNLALVDKRVNERVLCDFYNTVRVKSETQLSKFIQLPRPKVTAPDLLFFGEYESSLDAVLEKCPNIRKLALRSIPEGNEFCYNLAKLPHLEVFSIEYTYNFGWGMIPDDDVLPAPVLKSLTHLYCEFVAPWGTDTNSVEISVGSYPSLTHVALNTVNVDSEEELDPSWDIPEAVGKWLDIPSLKKLILRFPSDDSDVMEQYCTSELGAKQITDRRVICIRMPVGEPSNNDDHFALLDRVWELGEEAYTNNVTA